MSTARAICTVQATTCSIGRKFYLLHEKQKSLAVSAKAGIKPCLMPDTFCRRARINPCSTPDAFHRRAVPVSLTIPSAIVTQGDCQTREASLPDKYNVMPPRRGATRLGPRVAVSSTQVKQPRRATSRTTKTLSISSSTDLNRGQISRTKLHPAKSACLPPTIRHDATPLSQHRDWLSFSVALNLVLVGWCIFFW